MLPGLRVFDKRTCMAFKYVQIIQNISFFCVEANKSPHNKRECLFCLLNREKLTIRIHIAQKRNGTIF